MTKMKFWLYDIDCKNLTQANGPIFIKRIRNSSIKFGNNFRYNSFAWSNPVGLNRSCQISTLRENAEIIIGDNFGMSDTVISCFKKITIGNNVLCGGNVTIMDTDWHSLNPNNRNAIEEIKSEEIVIEDNVWLGYNVIVCKGVIIGNNSTIAAGSVVIKNIPSNCIAGGIPCKLIKKIDEIFFN